MLQLQKSITFTDAEYQNLLKNKLSLIDLKAILVSIGVKCDESNLNRIENFVFNSVVRKKVPFRLFCIYKKLAQRRSFEEIKKYVKFRRLEAPHITFYYIPRICGIILSGLDQHEIEKLVYKETGPQNINHYIDFGKRAIGLSNSEPYKGELCSCDLLHYTADRERILGCSCCLNKAILFAKECIINIGSSFFEKELYKFLLFSEIRIIISDVINLIVLIYVDIL